jgi:RND family efflux transporter MFP subunit
MAEADKRELLGKLKIDRAAPPPKSRVGAMVAIGVGVAVAIAVAFGVYRSQTTESVVIVTTLQIDLPEVAQTSTSLLDASGYVIARRQATVSAKVTGKVDEVLIEEGMRVEQGQVLARLDDSVSRGEFELTQAQLKSAESAVKELDVQIRQAKLDEQRARDLAERKLVSQADADRTQLAREALEARLARSRQDIKVSGAALAVQQRVLDDFVVRAPFAGVIVAKAAQPGEIVSPISAGGGFTRTGIGTLVDMDSLEVEVDVNEAYINRVRGAAPVAIVLNAYSDWQIPGRVIAIIPTADRSKATVQVRIGIDVKDERILPDMGVKVSFLESALTAQSEASPLMIPRSVVRDVATDPAVFVVGNDSRVERRRLRLGEAVGDRLPVLEGLLGGETVVASEQSPLSQGTLVTTTKD